MSIFDFPRIHIAGTMLINPGTGNNDSASPGTELTVVSDSERVCAMTKGMDDDTFRQWMMGLDDDGLLRCQWNYFGDMSYRFIDVRVTGVQRDPTRVEQDPRQDSVIGGRLDLVHSLVCDANPEGFDSTQIFAEALQLRAPAALDGAGVFLSRTPRRATTRGLNWYRNVSYHGPFGLPPDGANGQLSSGGAGGASASFQHAIPVTPEDLLADPAADGDANAILHRLVPKGSSPALLALVAALRQPGCRGLVLRYNLYLCSPKLSDTELAKRFAKGEVVENPGYGLVIGTLAPWFDGEPASAVPGRFLKPISPFQNPYRPTMPYFVAPMVAALDEGGQRLSIDAVNSLPDDGPEGYKYDLGPLTIGIRAATPTGVDPASNGAPVAVLGQIPPGRDEFLRRGGIYDLDLSGIDPALRARLTDAGQELVLVSGTSGVLQAESEYYAVSDSGCIYLDEPAPGRSWDAAEEVAWRQRQISPALRGEVEVFLWRRGVRPAGPVPLTIEEWRLTPTGYPNQAGAYRFPIHLASSTATIQDGRGRISLRPSPGAGLHRFRIVTPGLWPSAITPRTLAYLAFQEFFVECRVLPYDDYSAIADDQLTWPFIYDQIFRYYDLILPAMSRLVDMKDESIWSSPTTARYILRTTDPALWDCSLYMPRTRDLSRSRRELLWRWCRMILRRHGQDPDARTASPAQRPVGGRP